MITNTCFIPHFLSEKSYFCLNKASILLTNFKKFNFLGNYDDVICKNCLKNLLSSFSQKILTANTLLKASSGDINKVLLIIVLL